MAYVELTIDQGTTFETSLSLTNDDQTTINITDYGFASQIRKSYYSANAVANITVSIVDASTGNVKLSMTAANTANVRAGRYLYDLIMTDTGGVKTRVIEGIITVTPQVTR
jgi:hypothetical protein